MEKTGNNCTKLVDAVIFIRDKKNWCKLRKDQQKALQQLYASKKRSISIKYNTGKENVTLEINGIGLVDLKKPTKKIVTIFCPKIFNKFCKVRQGGTYIIFKGSIQKAKNDQIPQKIVGGIGLYKSKKGRVSPIYYLPKDGKKEVIQEVEKKKYDKINEDNFFELDNNLQFPALPKNSLNMDNILKKLGYSAQKYWLDNKLEEKEYSALLIYVIHHYSKKNYGNDWDCTSVVVNNGISLIFSKNIEHNRHFYSSLKMMNLANLQIQI